MSEITDYGRSSDALNVAPETLFQTAVEALSDYPSIVQNGISQFTTNILPKIEIDLGEPLTVNPDSNKVPSSALSSCQLLNLAGKKILCPDDNPKEIPLNPPVDGSSGRRTGRGRS